jgi:hypothetical protein
LILILLLAMVCLCPPINPEHDSKRAILVLAALLKDPSMIKALEAWLVHLVWKCVHMMFILPIYPAYQQLLEDFA